MKKLLTVLAFIVNFSLSGQIKYDDFITVLPYDSTQTWIFKSRVKAEISQKDFALVENILKECIDNYNVEQEKKFNDIITKHPESKLTKQDFTIELRDYKRQYVAVTNPKGEKEVWVNCFCGENKNWKSALVTVDDGGNCYFNLIINLSTGKYHSLLINGDA